MGIITTKSGRKILKRASSLWVAPYVYDANISDYVLGQTIYDLSAIIGDSIVLEQQDGDEQTKTNEFTGQPLVKNVTTGEWKFTAQCLDLQDKVLRALFSVYFNDTIGASAMRGDYTTMYAMIRIRFSDATTPDVFLPKVLLNSKLLLQQMKTRGSQGNLTGTALPSRCAIIEDATQHTLYGFSDQINGTTLYSVNTPVLFAPRMIGSSPTNVLFLNHRDEEAEATYFDQMITTPPTNGDCFARDMVVYDNAPSTYTILS